MPVVNIKYKLEIDSTITSIDHLKLEDEEVDLEVDQQSPTLFEGKVKDNFVDKDLFVDVLFGGASGKFSLEVSVCEINGNGEETGEWTKLKTFPIEGEIETRNFRLRDYLIDW